MVMQVWQAVKERLNGQSRSVGIARGWSSMPMAWRHLKLRSVRRALENAGKASDSLLVRPVRQKMKAIEMAFVCANPLAAGQIARDGIRTYREKTATREQLLSVSVLVFGIVIALGGCFAIRQYSQTQAQQEFEAPAARFAATLRNAIDGYLAVIDSVGAKFKEANEVDRWEFLEFSSPILPDFPGIRALEWIPRLSNDRRQDYENRGSLDGLGDFRITERDDQGGFVTAGHRGEYFPIYFAEPFEGDEHRLGFDLASDAEEWELLSEARDSGTMVAKQRPASTWKAENHPELAVVLPIFRTENVPFTAEERREELMGFVRGIFRLSDLIDAALPGLTAPPGLDIYIFDENVVPEDRLFYGHPSPLRAGRFAPLPDHSLFRGLFNATTHEVAGWKWSILIKPVPSHFSRVVTIAPWGFLIFMLLFTALLVQYLVSSQSRTREIECSIVALRSEIAERKRVESDLRAAKKQAEAANHAKSDFLAMMSHELRTPLNAVIGFSEVMSGEFLGPLGNVTYLGYAKDIQVSGKHLLSLINDILDLSKIEANKFELHEEAIDVAKAWREVQAILQERITAENLKIRDDISTRFPKLRADKRAFRQILINLLSNAVKFTPKGGMITVKADIDPKGCFVLSLADTGIGIPEQDVEAVLLPFKQVDSSLARQYEGTGLGLPLTKRLVEMHGGRLKLESTLGVGTTARVTFTKERVVVAPAERKVRRNSRYSHRQKTLILSPAVSA